MRRPYVLFCRPRTGMTLVWGRAQLNLWFSPRMWDFSFHAGPCCWFFVECGPIDLGVGR